VWIKFSIYFAFSAIPQNDSEINSRNDTQISKIALWQKYAIHCKFIAISSVIDTLRPEKQGATVRGKHSGVFSISRQVSLLSFLIFHFTPFLKKLFLQVLDFDLYLT